MVVRVEWVRPAVAVVVVGATAGLMGCSAASVPASGPAPSTVVETVRQTVFQTVVAAQPAATAAARSTAAGAAPAGITTAAKTTAAKTTAVARTSALRTAAGPAQPIVPDEPLASVAVTQANQIVRAGTRSVPTATVRATVVGSATHYANCDAVRAAGKDPLHRNDPGYRAGLDRDGDGVACEPYGARGASAATTARRMVGGVPTATSVAAAPVRTTTTVAAVVPASPTPTSRPTATTSTTETSTTTTTSSTTTAQKLIDTVYFPNCSDAWAAGVAPLTTGEPGYRIGLDADHDGIACEQPPRPSSTSSAPSSTATSTAQKAISDVYYENCTAARAAGAAPLHRGDPGYRAAMDRDGDGIACE